MLQREHLPIVVRPSTKSVGEAGTVWGCQRIWLGSDLSVAGSEQSLGCAYGLRGECRTAGLIRYNQLRWQTRQWRGVRDERTDVTMNT